MGKMYRALLNTFFGFLLLEVVFCFSPLQKEYSRTHLSPSKTSLKSHQAVDPLEVLQSAVVVDPKSGKQCKALDGLALGGDYGINNPLAFFDIRNSNKNADRKSLVIVMPQLGDFDSAEYAELLAAVKPDLDEANISLRLIGIGDAGSANRFCRFAGLSLDCIRIDPGGSLHRQLKLHSGPNWDVPSFIPKGILRWFAKDYCGAPESDNDEQVARAWLNYMAMCAGIAAPDTLPEIIRGYLGDKSAPERLRPDETVRVGDNLIAVTGTTDVKLGPLEYQSLWKNEKGYQRPVELATVRLRVMVEVLSNFGEYVPSQQYLDLRGATYLFDSNGQLEYEHRDTGVLAYSSTMKRPLTFLQPYIGDKALNPLELGDSASEASPVEKKKFQPASS